MSSSFVSSIHSLAHNRLRKVVNINKNHNHLSISVKGLVSRDVEFWKVNMKFCTCAYGIQILKTLLLCKSNCNRFAVHVHLYPILSFYKVRWKTPHNSLLCIGRFSPMSTTHWMYMSQYVIGGFFKCSGGNLRFRASRDVAIIIVERFRITVSNFV